MLSLYQSRSAELSSMVKGVEVAELLRGAETEEIMQLAQMLDADAHKLKLLGEMVILSGTLIVPSVNFEDGFILHQSETVFEGVFNGFTAAHDSEDRPHLAYHVLKPKNFTARSNYFHGELALFATGDIARSSLYLSEEEYDLRAAVASIEAHGFDLSDVDELLYEEDASSSLEQVLGEIDSLLQDPNISLREADDILQYCRYVLFGNSRYALRIITQRYFLADSDVDINGGLVSFESKEMEIKLQHRINLVLLNNPEGTKVDRLVCMVLEYDDSTMYLPVTDILGMHSLAQE